MVAAIVGAVAAIIWWVGFIPLVALGVVWFYASVIVVVICKGVDSAATVVGPGTPKGQRWVIAALAQRPGTKDDRCPPSQRLGGETAERSRARSRGR